MRYTTAGLVALALHLSGAQLPAQGAEELSPIKPLPWSAWTAVSRLQGQVSFQLEGSSEKAADTSSRSLTQAESFRMRFELELDRDSAAQGGQHRTWRIIRADGVGRLTSSYTITGTPRILLRGKTTGEFAGPLDLRARPSLSLNIGTGEWTFLADLKPVIASTQTTTFNHCHWDKVTADTYSSAWRGELSGHTAFKQVAPRNAVPYGASVSRQLNHPQGLDGLGGAGQSTLSSRVEFWPVLDDVELTVRIKDYEGWRPEGNIEHPTRAGGKPLAVTAVLRTKAAGNPPPPAIRELSFALLETSREPGVCLNWPLGAKDQTPDLRLSIPAGLDSLATIDAEGQRVDFKRLAPIPDGAAGEVGGVVDINSHDFGGRSYLKVTAHLVDGRIVTAEFATHPVLPTAIIEVPFSRGEAWIAESWLKANGVGQREENTDEDGTPEADGHDGDGFSLYEEYRGWVVDGRHVSGDPKKKELFVLNLGEPDLLKGVQLFENLTDLKVHRLKPGEMDPAKREMNANRAKGPHRVTQHGIVLRTDPSVRGAQTDMVSSSANNLPGRPKFVKQISIGPASPPEDVLEPGTIASLAGYHESAVAHELLHAVGVEHHGEGDGRIFFTWLFANDPRIRGTKPGFFEDTISDPTRKSHPTRVTILEEDGADYAQKIQSEMEERVQPVLRGLFGSRAAEKVATRRAKSSETKFDYTLEEEAEIELSNSTVILTSRGFSVGEWQGQGSGDTGCVIRYYFSTLYPKKGADNTYYLVPPQSEPIGRHICRTADGTGINAADHQPQPRYGPAAANRGNCLGQICVNDAVPPKKR